MSEGWICPRCGRALAPWMSECPCYLTKTVTSSNYIFGNNFHVSDGGPCQKICQHKTDLGYCKFTACVNPDYGGDPNYGIGNEC